MGRISALTVEPGRLSGLTENQHQWNAITGLAESHWSWGVRSAPPKSKGSVGGRFLNKTCLSKNEEGGMEVMSIPGHVSTICSRGVHSQRWFH